MKKLRVHKGLAAALAIALCFTLVPASVYAGEQSAAADEELPEAVKSVQALADALPAVEEVQAMQTEEQNAVYTKAQAAFDAYGALSEAEQAQVDVTKIEALFGYFNSMVSPAAAAVSYQTCTVNGDNSLTWKAQTVDSYTVVAADTTTWSSGWYVVNGNVTIDYSNGVNVSGNVSLILTDGCTLTVNRGIHLTEGNSLTIYGQAGGTGKLVAQADGSNAAGIGGRDSRGGETCGSLIVYGGNVTAKGDGCGSGIGGGGSGGGNSGGDGGNLTVYGGTVTAKGGDSGGTGIGGGASSGYRAQAGNGGDLVIYGGTVTATGGNNSSGRGGVGIGGGSADQPGNGGSLTIYDGTVHAVGGTGTSSSGGGKPIGGGKGAGSFGADTTITYQGGIITQNGAVTHAIYSVAVTPGSHMSSVSSLNQKVANTTDITTITITAENGYCFPADYVASISGVANGTVNGLTITRTNDTTITIAGKLTANTSITMPAASARTYTLTAEAPVFDDVTYGYGQPAAKPLTITSSGNSNTIITGVALGGANADAFGLNQTSGTQIAAGAVDTTTYTIQPKAGLDAGTYAATVTVTYQDGTGTATVTKDLAFTVGKAASSYTAPTGLTAVYGQKLSDVKLPAPENGTVSWVEGADTSVGAAGSQKFHVKFTPTDSKNYQEIESVEVSLTVAAKPLADSMIAAIADQYYTGTKREPGITVTDTAGITDGDYTVSYSDNTDVGTATVTITGKNNYQGTAKQTFAIKYVEAPAIFAGDAALQPEKWYTSDVILDAQEADAWSVSKDGVQFTDNFTVSTEGTNALTLYFKNAAGQITAPQNVTVKLDKTAPDGDIKIKDNSFKKLLNQITFGAFFKETVDVEITAEDAASGVADIEYYRSGEVLTEEQVKALDASAWSVYERKLTETAVDAEKFIYYVRITDRAGHTSLFGSDGATFDTSVPVIDGIADGGTYCLKASFTVEETNLKLVTLDGEELAPEMAETTRKTGGGTYTVTEPGQHEILVTDQADNQTACTITVNAAHTPNEDDKNCETPITCKICGTVTTEAKTHDFTGKWHHDASGHWHVCQNENCEMTDAKTAHSGGKATADSKPVCKICGAKYGSLAPAKATKVPQTGDHNKMTLWMALMLASLAGIGGTVIYRKKKM